MRNPGYLNSLWGGGVWVAVRSGTKICLFERWFVREGLTLVDTHLAVGCVGENMFGAGSRCFLRMVRGLWCWIDGLWSHDMEGRHSKDIAIIT